MVRHWFYTTFMHFSSFLLFQNVLWIHGWNKNTLEKTIAILFTNALLRIFWIIFKKWNQCLPVGDSWLPASAKHCQSLSGSTHRACPLTSISVSIATEKKQLLSRKSNPGLTWVLPPIPAMQKQQTGKHRNHICFQHRPRQPNTPHLELLCSYLQSPTFPNFSQKIFPNDGSDIFTAWDMGIFGKTLKLVWVAWISTWKKKKTASGSVQIYLTSTPVYLVLQIKFRSWMLWVSREGEKFFSRSYINKRNWRLTKYIL